MPELPEVETMVRGLRPVIEGHRIESIKINDETLLENCSAADLESEVVSEVVESVDRRGKWVLLRLKESSGIIVIQPRMTGAFYLVESAQARHIRLTFKVSEPDPRFPLVHFNDPRRLGRLYWHQSLEQAEVAFRGTHGPDALEITSSELAGRLAKTNRAIKPSLMDQKVLAGIGNIYADELLHRAGVHPERIASSLDQETVDRLHRAMVEILEIAIAAEGSSFDQHYRTVLGTEGGFLAINHVYRRTGQPCNTCGTSIARANIKGLIGRSTHYCIRCQPLDSPS